MRVSVVIRKYAKSSSIEFGKVAEWWTHAYSIYMIIGLLCCYWLTSFSYGCINVTVNYYVMSKTFGIFSKGVELSYTMLLRWKYCSDDTNPNTLTRTY